MYPRAHRYFTLALLITVAGFFPSYFAVLRTTDAVHHFHGLTATAWMLLLILQSWLYAQGKLSLHRTLGRLSLILVPGFLASGMWVVRTMLISRGGFNLTFGAQLAAVDGISLAAFAGAYGLGFHYRRNLALHARFMASTVLLVLPPALARLLPAMLPAIRSFELAFHLSFALTELVVLALLWDDRRSGRVRAPYLLLLGALLAQQVAFVLVPHFRS